MFDLLTFSTGPSIPVVSELHVGGKEVVAVAVPLQALPPSVHIHSEPLLKITFLSNICTVHNKLRSINLLYSGMFRMECKIVYVGSDKIIIL
jgi:hypothetical protein